MEHGGGTAEGEEREEESIPEIEVANGCVERGVIDPKTFGNRSGGMGSMESCLRAAKNDSIESEDEESSLADSPSTSSAGSEVSSTSCVLLS